MSGGGECVADVGGAGEAGGDRIAAGLDQVGEPVTGPSPLLLVQQSERDGEGVDGGAVADDEAVVVDVVLLEGGAGAFSEAGEVAGGAGVPEGARGPGGDDAAAVQAGGGPPPPAKA